LDIQAKSSDKLSQAAYINNNRLERASIEKLETNFMASIRGELQIKLVTKETIGGEISPFYLDRIQSPLMTKLLPPLGRLASCDRVQKPKPVDAKIGSR
jgi:hypothetical protein